MSSTSLAGAAGESGFRKRKALHQGGKAERPPKQNKISVESKTVEDVLDPFRSIYQCSICHELLLNPVRICSRASTKSDDERVRRHNTSQSHPEECAHNFCAKCAVKTKLALFEFHGLPSFTVSNPAYVKCPICRHESDFDGRLEIADHVTLQAVNTLRQHEGQLVETCRECPFCLTSLTGLSYGTFIHHMESCRQRRVNCPYCNLTFQTGEDVEELGDNYYGHIRYVCAQVPCNKCSHKGTWAEADRCSQHHQELDAMAIVGRQMVSQLEAWRNSRALGPANLQFAQDMLVAINRFRRCYNTRSDSELQDISADPEVLHDARLMEQSQVESLMSLPEDMDPSSYLQRQSRRHEHNAQRHSILVNSDEEGDDYDGERLEGDDYDRERLEWEGR